MPPIPNLSFTGGAAGPSRSGDATSGAGNVINLNNASDTSMFWIVLAVAIGGGVWLLKRK